MSARNDYHYLPVDDRAAEWGFYLNTTGRVLNPVTPNTPHGLHPEMYMFDQSPASVTHPLALSPKQSGRILPEFAVVYVTDSHGVFQSDETGVVEFDKPTLLFLFPGVWHRYRTVGSSKTWLSQRWLGFNGDLAYRLMAQGFVTPETAVRTAARSRRLAAAFDRLIDLVAANPAMDTIILSMRGLDLLADCIESARDGQKDVEAPVIENPVEGSDALVNRMLELIWGGSHQNLTMDQLCEAVGAKRRSMERWFRDIRGHSLLTEVNICRCRRARRLLETTDLPVKNVCWLAGFRNIEQMRLNFLQTVGMAPEYYRKNRRRI
jgi:AraC-like DNA-binding protein